MTKHRRYYIFAIAFAIVLLRLPSLWIPILDVDEAIFANIANRLLDGGVPYVDMVDNKPMGIFYFYSVVFGIFGRGNMIAVHAVTMLVVAATCYYIYKISGSLPAAGNALWAPLLYAVLTTAFIPKFIATEIEIIMMLPLTMGVWFYILGEKHANATFFLISGFLSGLAIIFKYQAGINLAVIGIYWLWQWKNPSRLALFLAGYMVAPAAMILHLYSVGSINAFVGTTLTASAAYINLGMEKLNTVRQFLTRGMPLILCGYIGWAAAIWAIISLFKPSTLFADKDSARKWQYLIAAWFLLSFLPVITGSRFYGHYFIQLMPALSILAAPILSKMWESKTPRRFVFASIAFSIMATAPERYFIDKINAWIGEDNPNSYRPIAEYIKQRTTKDDFIYAWGFAPCIYYFSERKSASRFPYTDPLVGRVNALNSTIQNPIDTSALVDRTAWDVLWKDFDGRPPKYIVDTSPANLHGYAVYPIKNYLPFANYLSQFYQQEIAIGDSIIYRRKVSKDPALPVRAKGGTPPHNGGDVPKGQRGRAAQR